MRRKTLALAALPFLFAVPAPLTFAPDIPALLAQLPATPIAFDSRLLDERETRVVRKLIDASRLLDEVFLRQVSQENPALRNRLAKVIGRRFDADDIGEAVALLSRRPAVKAARTFGISAERAETLLAGALLLAGVSRVLGVSLELGRGGLREGAALELATVEAVRAA